MRSKSSRVILMPAEWPMAMRCRTAFVEPPRAMTVTIEFSIDSYFTDSTNDTQVL